jgi:APA family basic amino acid/polyamine antiporter
MLGLGSILGTGVFVSLALATGMAGSSVLLALVIAAALAVGNGLSSARLAAAFPVSGGTYEYAYRVLTPTWGRIAGLTFLVAKTASCGAAALTFVGYLSALTGADLAPWTVKVVAGVGIIVATALVARGLSRTTLVNHGMVAVTLAGLALFVAAAMSGGGWSMTRAWGDARPDWLHVFEASAFIFVAFTGYGRIATLGEEVVHPERTIPRAVVVTLGLTLAVYLAVAWAALGAVGPSGFSAAAVGNGAPLANVARDASGTGAALIVAIASLTALCGVVLNLILGLSRVVLAMSRRGDLPTTLSTLHAERRTPAAAVWAVGLATLACVLVLGVASSWKLSAASVLVYYGITNVSAFNHERAAGRRPIVPVIGAVGCIFLGCFAILSLISYQ